MVSETRYLSGNLAEEGTEDVYKLDTVAGTGHSSNSFLSVLQQLIGIRVWKRDQNGTETEITDGTPVAVADISNSNLQDNQYNDVTATWNCPQTTLDSTDEIVVRVYIKTGDGDWTQLTYQGVAEVPLAWRTVGLNATSLDSATWTVHYIILLNISDDIKHFQFGGTPSSRIENFTYTPAVTYTLSGYTRDQNGNPLGNCDVVLFSASDDSVVDTTTSDANGYFEFTGLTSSGAYYLRAYKSGTPNLFGATTRDIYANGSVDIYLYQGEPTPENIRLRPYIVIVQKQLSEILTFTEQAALSITAIKLQEISEALNWNHFSCLLLLEDFNSLPLLAINILFA